MDSADGLLVRRPGPADAPALFDLVAASDLNELGYVDYEPADAVEELARTDVDWTADAWLATLGARAVGYAVVTDGGEVDLYLHPDEPDSLFVDLLNRVRRRTAEVGSSRELRMWAPHVEDGRTARLLDATDWTPVRRFARLAIDLQDERPATDAPPGLTLRSDAAETIMHAVITEAFTGHFGSTPTPFDDWIAREKARPGYNPALWLLAEADGEPAGCLIGRHMSEQGWVQYVGVLHAFRGRGIGRWLLLTAFDRFAERGHRTAALGVDVENATGALRLYESCGMRLVAATDCYRLELPAVTP